MNTLEWMFAISAAISMGFIVVSAASTWNRLQYRVRRLESQVYRSKRPSRIDQDEREEVVDPIESRSSPKAALFALAKRKGLLG